MAGLGRVGELLQRLALGRREVGRTDALRVGELTLKRALADARRRLRRVVGATARKRERRRGDDSGPRGPTGPAHGVARTVHKRPPSVKRFTDPSPSAA